MGECNRRALCRHSHKWCDVVLGFATVCSRFFFTLSYSAANSCIIANLFSLSFSLTYKFLGDEWDIPFSLLIYLFLIHTFYYFSEHDKPCSYHPFPLFITLPIFTDAVMCEAILALLSDSVLVAHDAVWECERVVICLLDNFTCHTFV